MFTHGNRQSSSDFFEFVIIERQGRGRRDGGKRGSREGRKRRNYRDRRLGRLGVQQRIRWKRRYGRTNIELGFDIRFELQQFQWTNRGRRRNRRFGRNGDDGRRSK